MSNARFSPHQRIFLRNGAKATSVTTALGELAKPALYRWNNLMGLKGIDTLKYVDEKAAAGSLAHAMILADLRGIEPDMKEYTQYAIDQAENSFLKYLDWKKGRDIEPILVEEALLHDPIPTEETLFGDEGIEDSTDLVPPYCGIIDLYCKLNGVPTLVDFKTSKAVYDEHWYQVSAYKFLLQHGHLVADRPGFTWERGVEDTRILQIGRDETEGFGEHGRKGLDNEFAIFQCALRIHLTKKKMKGE